MEYFRPLNFIKVDQLIPNHYVNLIALKESTFEIGIATT